MAGLPLYAVFDPARDPRIFPVLKMLGTDVQCLFRSPLDPQLECVSPHLVPIASGDPLATWWRGQGRGQAWGILLATPVIPAELRHHLRTLLRVTLPGQQIALFRFWDPRVLRDWLPCCDADQLARFFGPVVQFHVEAEDGASILTYTLDGQQLTVE